MHNELCKLISFVYDRIVLTGFTLFYFLIAGASSGIGAATAILFSKLGAKLALCGRNEDNLKRTAEECEKQLATNKVYI